jgi:LuxR family transcriptional regulator, maltose regulon positive regulatory protein
MAAALDAGRALFALRERGDPSPATALPWHDTLTLRAHVVPAHLSELAAAAAAAGNGQVGVVLSQLPDVRRHVADVSVRHRHGPTAAWATEQSRLLPARPEHELRISTLGAMSLHRGATEVVDADWTGRARVRQLLAHLVHHRKTSRQRIVDDLWPGLDTTKALHNLRVNLAHLQRVLQPERQRDDPPWFVRSTEQTITLVDECVVVDVDEFEDTHRRARALDDRGRSTEAAALYRKAVDLYRGEYLEELPEAAWAEMERARLHALALGAQCRLGELLLARGEPEEAARHAADVLRTEPLHERAARLLAEALAAQGDRVAARRSLEGVLARLTEQRLRPEHATAKLAERLGRGE